MLSDPHRELLSPAGMANARASLISKHSWFLHVTGCHSLSGIREVGLLPRNPGEPSGSPAPVDPEIAKAVGSDTGNIVCLMPIFTFNTRPQRSYAQALLAISGADLPLRIGIDWSYDGCMTLVDILVDENPGMPVPQIFAEVVRRTGCVISYDPVPPAAIRVWTVGLPRGDPGTWPTLASADPAEIAALP